MALSLTVTNRVAIPANADAVDLNLTVTSPAGGGWLTVYPCGSPQPNSSNLNFAAGQTIPNQAWVRLPPSPDNLVGVFNGSSGTTQVVLDVQAIVLA